MSETDKVVFSLLQRLSGFKLFTVALGFAVGSLLLYAWSPFWLRPPYHAYTSIIYVFLSLVWIPLLGYSIWRIQKNRLLLVLFSILFLPAVCIASQIVAPQIYVGLLYMQNQDYGSLRYGGLSEQHCVLDAPAFTCKLALGSSDNDYVTSYSYRFELLEPLPLMRLVEFSTYIDCNPGYVTCPNHNAP